MYSFSWWFWEEYYYYCACVLLITIVSLIVELVATRRNWINLSQMARLEVPVDVIRDGKSMELSVEILAHSMLVIQVYSSDLVPGDVIEIRSGMTVPCDTVLLHGTCVVNEAMLTGTNLGNMLLFLTCFR